MRPPFHPSPLRNEIHFDEYEYDGEVQEEDTNTPLERPFMTLPDDSDDESQDDDVKERDDGSAANGASKERDGSPDTPIPPSALKITYSEQSSDDDVSGSSEEEEDECAPRQPPWNAVLMKLLSRIYSYHWNAELQCLELNEEDNEALWWEKEGRRQPGLWVFPRES